MGIFGFAFVACAALGAGAWNANVSADAEQGSDLFTETKCQISNDGERMLIVTGIKDVDLVYQLGYEVNGADYVAKAGDTAENDTYYESLTLGGVTKTASEFLAGSEGLLVWEIAYDSTVAYSVQAFAYVGEMNGDQLIAPDENTRTYATAKNNFNVFAVTFETEDGEEIEVKNMNYGSKVVAPQAPAKENAEFAGWYCNGVEFNFDRAVTGPITLVAKYNEAVNYTVEVLVAQYNVRYESANAYGSNGNRYMNTKMNEPVDKTSEYASLFGLDENNQAKAIAGSVVDLSAKVNALHGAKVDEGSVLSATVAEDGSTKLTVKLDFDEAELGFKLQNLCTTNYVANDQTPFVLTYVDGICGVSMPGISIGNGSGVWLTLNETVNFADVAALRFIYKERSSTASFIAAVAGDDVKTADFSYLTGTAGKFVDGTIDLKTKFSTLTAIKAVHVKLLSGGQKDFFIGGIEKVGYKKETVTYSMENGNLLGITRTLGVGEISTTAQSHYFNNASQGVTLTTDALYYSYKGDGVTGAHTTGIVIDLGGIKLSDYETIEIVFGKTVLCSDDSTGKSFPVFCGETEIDCHYSDMACYKVDVLAKAQEKGLTVINTIELSNIYWADVVESQIWVAYVKLVAKA